MNPYDHAVFHANKGGLACLGAREAKGYEHPLLLINGDHQTDQLLHCGFVTGTLIEGKRHLHLTDKGRKALKDQR